MNKNFLHLTLSIILFSSISLAQKELTLEDAVLKQWTSLYPERIKNIQWNKTQDFFDYRESDSLISVFDVNNVLQYKISLDQINRDLDAEEKMSTLPMINWLDTHSFIFKNNQNYYMHNTKRGEKTSFLFHLEKNASNLDFNNQNDRCAYTIDNNLYVVNTDNNHINLTNEENKNIIFGQAVHRYEFGIYKGTFWSNNGDKIAFYRKDESMVTDYPLMNISSRVGHVDIIKYPMAGMSSHHVVLGVYNFNTNKTIYIDTGEPKEQYLTNISWDPKDKYIYIAVLNRDQNHLKFNQYSAIDGSFVKTLFEEKSDKYVQPLHPMEFLTDNTFLWRSERNGFDNFYLYNTDGTLIKQVLNKDHVVKDYYGHNNDNIYFSSFTKDGLGVDLWMVSIKKKYKKKIVSDGNFHSFKISPTKSFFIDEFSSLEIPRITRIINYKGNLVTELLNSKNPLSDYNIGNVDLIKLKTDDNTKLNARLIKPYNFDKNTQYSALIYVYNGPGVQLINNRWLAGAPLWMYYLANQGYIVFTIDGRGSENRGRDFEQVIFKELGAIEMIDQIKGYDYLVNQTFVNPSKVAIHGWSYGGFMTTNLLLNYPNLFTCGVAGGPVTNWEYYEVMYTERYMDHPDNNKDGYEKTNLINKTHLLQDPLLMIHGLVDDIVLPKHSLEFVKSSVDNNIQMDYFIYPGHPHNVRGKDRLHLIQKIIDYIRVNNN